MRIVWNEPKLVSARDHPALFNKVELIYMPIRLLVTSPAVDHTCPFLAEEAKKMSSHARRTLSQWVFERE
jgi:hypothetical protein